jgi:L-rhamnose-H+ transport protein
LNIKNGSGYQYLASHVKIEHAHHGGTGSEHAPAETAAAATTSGNVDLKIPVASNYFFSMVAGTCWYFQFFFYTMGASQMGQYDFASWTLHMASIIIFATMWGWIFHEWKGSSKKAHLFIGLGVFTLILSTCVIGAGVGWDKLLAWVHSQPAPQ